MEFRARVLKCSGKNREVRMTGTMRYPLGRQLRSDGRIDDVNREPRGLPLLDARFGGQYLAVIGPALFRARPVRAHR